MNSTASTLPTLLAAAWLLPLASFAIIVLFGKRMGPHGKAAGHLSVAAIVSSAVLSFIGLFAYWLPSHPLADSSHHAAADHGAEASAGAHSAQSEHHAAAEESHAEESPNGPPPYYCNDWYDLGVFGKLRLSIGYYIDALTVTMFCMVTLIASCVHIYALGYMHDELHDPFVDHEVTLSDGKHLHRNGRFYRFFQYLSLFSFSMLGIVIAGNVAMVFVFWELVGICSYFLIGFYIERHSASTAANKAFIVNRVGDFGMLIGMMALWSSLGTFAFGDKQDADGKTVLAANGAAAEPGLFTQLRTAKNHYRLTPPAEMAGEEARGIPSKANSESGKKYPGQWLLLIAGVGIFCGCVGKSAQFPLHVWLPDAMEGPTPVSALVHSATMVAAGVYLVGRFYPAFTPEALLVIAVIGCITLALAATIAITAVDIKRVLAYSTVSQLGYMMLSLGLGGWIAGMFHLITHAFFKSLLFLCSGSVIHAVHTNDMTEMGGLRKKMPITAYTMLVGCLAIIGAGIPLSAYGLSGYYSKDAIIEQAWSYAKTNGGVYWLLCLAPVIGAAITAFYMFRLWYMTFAGEPRNRHKYDHAHESPTVMTYPLLLLAFFAIAVGWGLPFKNLSITNLLAQAQPVGTAAGGEGTLLATLTVPAEHLSHADAIKRPAGLAAFGAAMFGLFVATLLYLWRTLNPAEIKQSFAPIHKLLWNKWWFDELYAAVFIAPALWLSKWISKFDRGVIDSILHGSAATAKGGSKIVDAVLDRTMVDGSVNTIANWTWDFGLLLRKFQTGSIRQYVMFIVAATGLMGFAYIVASAVFMS